MSVPKPTSGGGYHKKPVLEKLKEEFDNKIFTCKEARTTVSGFVKNYLSDFINSGDIKAVTPKPGDVRKPSYPKEYEIVHKDDTEVKRR